MPFKKHGLGWLCRSGGREFLSKLPHVLSENAQRPPANSQKNNGPGSETSRHVYCSNGRGYLAVIRARQIELVRNGGETSQMNSASRAVAGTAQRAVPPMRVVPFNSPLRAIPGIDRITRSRIYPRGAVVFREGNVAHGVYVLSSGRAKISISSADGKKLILRIAKGGDILGLYAGLTGRAFEATAEMLESGRVDFIPRQELLNLIARQNGSSLNLLEVFSRQFSDLVDHTRMIALSESALEKLARLIMRWSRDFGERTNEGIRLRFLLTQEEIAQIIGASRETVTRLFSALKRDRIIRVKRDSMWICDSAALASLAQLSPEICG